MRLMGDTRHQSLLPVIDGAAGPVAEVRVAPQGIEISLLLRGQHQEVETVPALQLRESLRPRRADPDDLAGVKLEDQLEAFPPDAYRIESSRPGGVERERVRGHPLSRVRAVAPDHRPEPQRPVLVHTPVACTGG